MNRKHFAALFAALGVVGLSACATESDESEMDVSETSEALCKPQYYSLGSICGLFGSGGCYKTYRDFMCNPANGYQVRCVNNVRQSRPVIISVKEGVGYFYQWAGNWAGKAACDRQ